MNNPALWSASKQAVGKSTNNIINPHAVMQPPGYNISGKDAVYLPWWIVKSDMWQFKKHLHTYRQIVMHFRL